MAKSDVANRSSPSISRTPLALQIAAGLAIVGGFFFIKPYLGTVLFAALIAYAFNPVYKYLVKKTRKPNLSVLLTLFTAVLAATLACLFILSIALSQINNMTEKFKSQADGSVSQEIESTVNEGVDKINSTVAALPGGDELQVNKKEAVNNVRGAINDSLEFAADTIAEAGIAVVGLIYSTILSAFLISSMWRFQDDIVRLLKRMSPFDNSINNLYLKRVKIMTTGLMKGQFLIALAQGFTSAFALWVAGVDYFWFFFLICSFLSFIPLGAGVVTIPIAFILILSGDIWGGLFIIAWVLLVVSTVDNFMRPRLVGDGARLNSALMFLAVLSGLVLFGFIGIVYGPIIMILIVTTLFVYTDYNAKANRVGLYKKRQLQAK